MYLSQLPRCGACVWIIVTRVSLIVDRRSCCWWSLDCVVLLLVDTVWRRSVETTPGGDLRQQLRLRLHIYDVRECRETIWNVCATSAPPHQFHSWRTRNLLVNFCRPIRLDGVALVVCAYFAYSNKWGDASQIARRSLRAIWNFMCECATIIYDTFSFQIYTQSDAYHFYRRITHVVSEQKICLYAYCGVLPH